MLKRELICDYCGKVGVGDEHHFSLPGGWYVIGYHAQSFVAHDDWRITHHFCSFKCLDKAIKITTKESPNTNNFLTNR